MQSLPPNLLKLWLAFLDASVLGSSYTEAKGRTSGWQAFLGADKWIEPQSVAIVPEVVEPAEILAETTKTMEVVEVEKFAPTVIAPALEQAETLLPVASSRIPQKVNFAVEKAGAFFRSLSWRRDDHTGDLLAEESEVSIVESSKERREGKTARQFFAYLVPWQGRGLQPDDPEVFSLQPARSMVSDLVSLGDLATRQALHTAGKIKQQSRLVGDYFVSNDESPQLASPYFTALPWDKRLHLINRE